ncbi:hypothetical protein AK88_05456 [Plasmodium fragile]|uniref:Uncharacterized protein n=1 Tax=Plasmodium fragile TaxID=5857 RepID=A0A0D9QDJ2_PLAFR|nr:uncharacterized protein AK88_05456 [Plasmodium fragile]KJP84907.1 hypothetical protein AK88_05456 [Plasmodium fragile]
MLSAKNKFELARNRSCSSIRENLMCSSVILKNSSCLLKSSPTFDNTTQLHRRGEGLQDDMTDMTCPEEDLLRETSAKELHQYVYTSEVTPDDEVVCMSSEWTQDHDVKNEFKKGILYDKIVMSDRTYNTSVESIHSNFQTNKLDHVVNSIKFEENTSIKIPSYLRNSPLYVLYPELDYLKGTRVEELPEGQDDAGNTVQPHEHMPHLEKNKSLNNYLRYTLNNSHTTGRNRMYDYFESNKKNMVEIANPNDLNHTLLYTKKKNPTELIFNLYKNRYVTNSSNHTDNELHTLNTLKRLKMPFVEKNEKGENIPITSEVNAKRRVNLLQNGDASKDKYTNARGKEQVGRGGKPNYTVSLIDMSCSDKASLKTVHLNNDKGVGDKKNIFQLKKKTRKDVQVQTDQDDFEQTAKWDCDSDVQRVVSIFEGKKKKASPEDTHVGSSSRTGEICISYCDLEGVGQSDEETPTRSGDVGEVGEVGDVDKANKANEVKTHATSCNSLSPNGHPRMTQGIKKYNQFLRTRGCRSGLNRTVLKQHLSGPFIGEEASLNGAKASPGSGNGGHTNKAILIPKFSPPWVHNAQIGEPPTSASLIGDVPDVCPNELRNTQPKPSKVCVYIKSSAPRGHMQRCDTDRSGQERKVTTASDEECEKEKITNDLLLKKLYIEKKRQLYEKSKFQRAITSMLQRRAALRERVRDKYTGLAGLHGVAGVTHVGDVAAGERDNLLSTPRCARNRPSETYKRAHGSGAWRDTTQEGGHISSCSNVNLYSSNEQSDDGFGKMAHNAARNYSAQNGCRRVGAQLTEPGERNQVREPNWVNKISQITPFKEAVRTRRSDKLTNERSNGGAVHKSFAKYFRTSWRGGRARRCAADHKRLRSLSYKNRVSTLSVLEKSIQPLKEHAKRNVILGESTSDEKSDEKSYEQSDIIQSEINRCVERGRYAESGDETEDDTSDESTDEGTNKILNENKSSEDEQKGGIKITYNLGSIVKKGNPTLHEWVNTENTFIPALNETKGRVGKSQCNRNEDQTDEHSCERGDVQTANVEMEEGDSYSSIRTDGKRETSIEEKKNTMEINSLTSGNLQNKKTNQSDNLFRVKVTIKKASEGRKKLDKGSSNMEEGSNHNRYVLHGNVESMGSSSYKGNASNGYIKRIGLVPKEKGNFSDTEVATRKRNSESLTNEGNESNDQPGSRTFLRKNDRHGGGDYLKIKQKECANKRSHSHSKFSNQAEGSRDTLPGMKFTPKCNSPLCRGRSNETNQLLDLERIDPNKWIQKIFGDTH